MADKIFHFTPSPTGPAALREKGLYDSNRDSLRVAWKPRGGWGDYLRLLFILIPSSGSNNWHRWREAGASSTGSPEAQVVALPPLRDVS